MMTNATNTTNGRMVRGSLRRLIPVRMTPAIVDFADSVAGEGAGVTRSDVIRALIEAGKAAAMASGSLVIDGQPVTLNLRGANAKLD